jgi:hypothetical protein
MTTDEPPHRRADQCGLAPAPLFETEEVTVAGSHHVFLEGGLRSVFCGVHMEAVNQPDGAKVDDIRADLEQDLGLAP